MTATHFTTAANQPAPEEPATVPTGSDEPPVSTALETINACRCGHIQGAHEHYRRGTECALCECDRYRKERRRKRRD